MSNDTITTHEVTARPEYTHKSFELVFVNFCRQYQRKVEDSAGPKARREGRFLGLPGNASIQEMGRKLNEVTAAVGEPPQLEAEYPDDVPLKDALILSARHLAWSSALAGLSNRYIEQLDDFIDKERGSGRSNIRRLFNVKKNAVALKVAYNHSIRGYFDSGLAHTLGNDSPAAMSDLLGQTAFMTETEVAGLVKGLSLEIAAKRKLDDSAGGNIKVAYGSQAEDSIGGDLVIVGEEDLIFIDLKSKMPEKFPDGSVSTDLDYERGYKWIERAGEGRQVIVWAYSTEPVSQDSFELSDNRLAAALESISATAAIDNTNV